jgi:cytidine deaminase
MPVRWLTYWRSLPSRVILLTMSTLEDAARAARQHAYAPYSKFRVGAAVQMNGAMFSGVNVENASYPVSVCAERNAVAAAIAAGAQSLEAVAVCTEASPPSSPCGACRQVLREFTRHPERVTVVAINPQGERRSWTLAELLPDAFSGQELP